MDTPVTLAEPVNKVIVNPDAQLIVNGHKLDIGDDLTVTTSNTAGDGLIMTNAADEVIVNGDALFTTSSNHGQAFSTGNYTAGMMRVRGDFTQTRNGSTANTGSFISSGTKVIFDGNGTQTVNFATPGLTQSYFDDVGFENTSPNSVRFTSPVTINGQIQSPGHVTTVVEGNGNAVAVHGGLDADGLILDRVTLTVNGGQIDRFDNITFRGYSTEATQMTINHTDMNASFFGVDFEVTPGGGKYIVANDTDGGAPATLNMVNAQPADGSAFTTATGGFLINWTSQLHAVDDAVTTPEDTPITINVLDNDMNPNENALVVSQITQGSNGSVAIDPGGTSVTYTPSQDFNGTDTFTYTVADNIAEESDVGQVTVTVTANDDPIITVASELMFTNTLVGLTGNMNLTVQNTGDVNLNVSDLTVPSPFSVDSTPFSVGPGGSHDVNVSFTPGQPGDFESTLSITSDDPQTPVASVTVTGTGIENGDIGGDGQVNVLDVIALIQIILGQTPAPSPGSQSFQAADLNDDGSLNILDIVAVVNRILNPPSGKTVADITTPVHVALDPVQTTDNRRMHVPVSLSTDAAVAGLQMTLRYDPSNVRLLEPEPTERMGNLTMAWTDEEGVMQILIYSTTGGMIQPGETPIVLIPVDLQTKEGDLTLDRFIAAGPQAAALPVTITTGQLRVSTLPSAFSLGHNRPNPFNPSTTIAFEVPQAAHITLTIYNVLGQEVVRLIDEQRQPGRYEVVWNARNAQGATVSTGIYMYRLTSSTGFAEARRMTLLK